MATKSSNTHGNPYHDESTGEFTSAGNSSAPSSEAEAKPSGLDGGQKPDIKTPEAKKPKFKFKANIQDVSNSLRMSTSVSSVPLLGSARDIDEHLDDYFPPDVVKNIDDYFGKFSVPYKYFNLRTDPDQRCGVNIFAAFIGKKRWANNYLKPVDKSQFDSLIRNQGFRQLHRGISANNDEIFGLIANSYSSRENAMIYGSVGGTAYGIAVYASNYYNEALGYASYNRDHVMDLALNTRAHTMPYRTICAIRSNLIPIRDKLVSRVEQIFLNNGIESSRAKTMARSFGITLGDEGFVAMLLGVEWYNSGSYHMIENLGAMCRLMK